MLEVTKIYSVAGMLPARDAAHSAQAVPRAPPHISHAGLVGGGRIPAPRRDHAGPPRRALPR